MLANILSFTQAILGTCGVHIVLWKKTGAIILVNAPQWQQISVISLTTFCDEEDILWARNKDASDYVVKPSHLNYFVKIIIPICHFWFTIVTRSSEVEHGQQ